jgi:hypothetical protein
VWLDIKLNAPVFVIPEDILDENKNVLIVDLGTVKINS